MGLMTAPAPLLAPGPMTGGLLTPRQYPRASEDDVWMAQMRERRGRNAPYAQAGPYETTLAPDEEAAFRQWLIANKVPFNPTDKVADYDMRGYYRDIASGGGNETAVNPNDHHLHFPDTYKTPYHQSFSAESRYAKPNAPVWINDHQLADPATGRVVFDERAR